MEARLYHDVSMYSYRELSSLVWLTSLYNCSYFVIIVRLY